MLLRETKVYKKGREANLMQTDKEQLENKTEILTQKHIKFF